MPTLAEILAQLSGTYGQQQASPGSFRELPQAERSDANRMRMMALAQAIGNAQPGYIGSGLAQGFGEGEQIRQQAVEAHRQRALEQQEMQRRSLEGQARVTEAQERLAAQQAERERSERMASVLADPPEGADIDPRLWAEFPVEQRMKIHAEVQQGRAKQDQQRQIADRVAAAAEARGGNGDIARELILSGATPGQAMEAAMPEKQQGLTPYQQIMLGRGQAGDAREAETRAMREAEQEAELEAIGRELSSAGMEPSGVLAVDRMRYQRLLQDPMRARMAAGGGMGEAPPPAVRVTAPPRFNARDVLPPEGGPAGRRVPPPASGLPATGEQRNTASVFRGATPSVTTSQNTLITQREKQADTIIRASGLPAAAAADPDLRAWVLSELAKPGVKPEAVLAVLRSQLGR
jgi:hypothetical protein